MRCYITENPWIKWLQTSVCSHFCLFSSNTTSTVSTYADEFVFGKFTFLFPRLPACRQVYRHAEGFTLMNPSFYLLRSGRFYHPFLLILCPVFICSKLSPAFVDVMLHLIVVAVCSFLNGKVIPSCLITVQSYLPLRNKILTLHHQVKYKILHRGSYLIQPS